MWYPKVKFKIKKIFNGRVALCQLDWCGILPNITFHGSQIESKLIAIEVSWLFGSTGGTTPTPFLDLIEKPFLSTGKFSYSPLNS